MSPPRPAITPMLFSASLFLVAVSGVARCASASRGLPQFPPLYSATFKIPSPPTINAEFRANYMQHKYDVNVNHIISGFLYMSPSQGKVRLDAAGDGFLEASFLDFTNTTSDGLVANSILAYEGSVVAPTCSTFFVAPFIPLISPDFLNATNAVYTGIQDDDLYGPVSAWQLAFTNVQVTIFLDVNNTLVRYDFAHPSDPLRTFTTTRFFNIIPGPVNATVFDTTCH